MFLKYAPHIITILALLFAGCSVSQLEPIDQMLFDEGLTHYGLGDYSNALNSFTEITDNYSSSDLICEAWYYRGLVELQLAEDSITEVIISEDYFKKALRSFEYVKDFNQYYVDAFYYRGYCFYNINNFDAAISIFKSVLTIYPEDGKADNACLYIGHSFRKQDLLDTSIMWYEKVIDQFSGASSYDNALFWAGDHYFIKREIDNNADKAMEYLKEYCDLADLYDPNYYLARNKIEVLENE